MPDLTPLTDQLVREYTETYVSTAIAPPIEMRPGAVWADGGETISIPFVDGSNARIEDDGEFVWTSENGQRTPISKLEDGHLANIIKMLSRNMIGIDEKSRQYQRNEETLILMRAERDKRSERP